MSGLDGEVFGALSVVGVRPGLCLFCRLGRQGLVIAQPSQTEALFGKRPID